MLFASPRGVIASTPYPAHASRKSVGHRGSDGSGPFAVSSAPAGAPLASLAGGALARRFYRWRGASGARYVVTIHAARDDGWLDVEGAVALIVEVDLDGRRRLLSVEADPSPARRREIQDAARASGRGGLRLEAHLHLLADAPRARARVAADLAAACAS